MLTKCLGRENSELFFLRVASESICGPLNYSTEKVLVGTATTPDRLATQRWCEIEAPVLEAADKDGSAATNSHLTRRQNYRQEEILKTATETSAVC